MKILDEHTESHQSKSKTSPVNHQGPGTGCIKVHNMKTFAQPTPSKRNQIKVTKSSEPTNTPAKHQIMGTNPINSTLPTISNGVPSQIVNQNLTLRWEYELENDEEEKTRLDAYKNERRKRYLANQNISYVDWLKTYHSQFKTITADTNNIIIEPTNRIYNKLNPQSLPDVVTSSVCQLFTPRIKSSTLHSEIKPISL